MLNLCAVEQRGGGVFVKVIHQGEDTADSDAGTVDFHLNTTNWECLFHDQPHVVDVHADSGGELGGHFPSICGLNGDALNAGIGGIIASRPALVIFNLVAVTGIDGDAPPGVLSRFGGVEHAGQNSRAVAVRPFGVFTCVQRAKAGEGGVVRRVNPSCADTKVRTVKLGDSRGVIAQNGGVVFSEHVVVPHCHTCRAPFINTETLRERHRGNG